MQSGLFLCLVFPMGFCVFLCKMCLGLLCQEGKSLRTCRPWHHLHLSKKLKGKCVHDIKCTGSFFGNKAQGQSHPCGYGWNFPGKKWAFHWDSFWEELYLRTGNEDSRGGASHGILRKTSFCSEPGGYRKEMPGKSLLCHLSL